MKQLARNRQQARSTRLSEQGMMPQAQRRKPRCQQAGIRIKLQTALRGALGKIE
jgi:hypothetical protein